MEIAAEIESPQEARAERMQIQLENMQNKGLNATSQNLGKLYQQWLVCPGAEAEVQKQFQQRVDKILKTGKVKLKFWWLGDCFRLRLRNDGVLGSSLVQASLYSNDGENVVLLFRASWANYLSPC